MQPAPAALLSTRSAEPRDSLTCRESYVAAGNWLVGAPVRDDDSSFLLRRYRPHGPHDELSHRQFRSEPSPADILNCRFADLDWRLGRVYFLAFLNPSRGQPDPALTARLASPATVDEPTTELD